MIKTTTQKEMRYDFILNALKTGDFNIKYAAEALGVNRNTITEDLKMLQLMYPQVKHVGSRGAASKWTWEENAPTDKPDRYSDKKTDEGYPDPTAAAAMRNVTDIYGSKAPGEVWAVQCANGSVENYLILKDFKGCCSTLKVYEQSVTTSIADFYNPAYCVCIDLPSKAYVDVRRITSKPNKYFLDKLYDIKNFPAVERKILAVMGFELPERVVEKEVIKEVPVVKEVPVEKEIIKEVPVEVSVDSVEVALLRQKADIYEKITWAFLNAGGES